jgi:hypothetical protein
MLGIETTLLKLPIILFSLGGEAQKAEEEFLIPGFFSFQEQGLNMIGQLVILVAIITADMFGYQIHPVIDQEPVGKPFQGEFAGGMLARNRVRVSVDFNPTFATGSEIRDFFAGETVSFLGI